MNQQNARQLFSALKAIATPAPLDALETQARERGPEGAQQGSLFVLCRCDGSFSYQFGDAEISRNEAARRLGAA